MFGTGIIIFDARLFMPANRGNNIAFGHNLNLPAQMRSLFQSQAKKLSVA